MEGWRGRRFQMGGTPSARPRPLPYAVIARNRGQRHGWVFRQPAGPWLLEGREGAARPPNRTVGNKVYVGNKAPITGAGPGRGSGACAVSSGGSGGKPKTAMWVENSQGGAGQAA